MEICRKNFLGNSSKFLIISVKQKEVHMKKKDKLAQKLSIIFPSIRMTEAYLGRYQISMAGSC